MLRSLRLLPGLSWEVEAPVTLGAMILLVWSRLTFLAHGPWVQDEVLFAQGLLHFQLSAHTPHPPGFPGWMALGHMLLPFVQDPLRSLQLASALLSIATIWPLAALGRRLSPPPVALAGALMVLLAPGAWLHAVRGLSSTPASFFLFLALAALTVPKESLRPTTVTLLLAMGVLVRPQLLPVAGVAWIALALRTASWRRLVPGLTGAAAAGTLSAAWMVHGELVHGEHGWEGFRSAFTHHTSWYLSHIVANHGSPPDWGIVKALGGIPGFLAVAVLAVMGLVVWWRRRPGEGLWAVLVVAVLVLELLMLHNRTYTRYAVPFALLCGPLAAVGASAVAPPVVAASGLLGLACWQAGVAYPLLVEQHAGRFPGWAAVEAAAGIAQRHDLELVVDSGLYHFATYEREMAKRAGEARQCGILLSPWAGPWPGIRRPYLVVTGWPKEYLGPLGGRPIWFGGVTADLEPYMQKRLLHVEVMSCPPLPVGRWWPVETDRQGRRFMWGSRNASIDLPPLPPWTWLRLRALPARGPEPLRIVVDGDVLEELPGDSGWRTVWVSPETLAGSKPHRITFRRRAIERPSRGDPRPLSVRIGGVRVVGPGIPWTSGVAGRLERRRYRIEIEGAYDPERFGRFGRGVWLRPGAVLRLPAGEGMLSLRVFAPRPGRKIMTVRAGGKVLAGPMDLPRRPRTLSFRVPTGLARHGMLELTLDTDSYCPARHGSGHDTRVLGVVLSRVAFQPPPATRWHWLW